MYKVIIVSCYVKNDLSMKTSIWAGHTSEPERVLDDNRGARQLSRGSSTHCLGHGQVTLLLQVVTHTAHTGAHTRVE